MISSDFEVVIIGGGPAGSVAGINLARAGINTAIIERKNFPREVLCGEFLSVEVTNHLKELSLFEKFTALNPNNISSLQLSTCGNKIFNSDLNFDGYSLKRSVFDQFLLNGAKESGAKIFQPAEVAGIKQEEKYFILNLKSQDKIENISGNFVIGAYGRSSILDKKIKRKFSEIRTGYIGIKFHLKKDLLSNIKDSTIYIFSGHNIYCGINTISNDEVTVCFLAKKNSSNLPPKELWNNLIKENGNFAYLFKDLTNIDINKQKIYGMGNIYMGKKELTPDGMIMIGDAAGMIAPVTGDGIGMAFQSAKIASGIIRDSINKNINRIKIENIYQTEWKNNFTERIAIAGFIQRLILNNYLEKIPSGITKYLLPGLISSTRN